MRELESNWGADWYPASLTVDFEDPREIKTVSVWPYWGGDNHIFKYTVEASVDGKDWQQVGDMSKNSDVATPEGHTFSFEPITCRYVRVTMLHHNLNRGVHIVEVDVE